MSDVKDRKYPKVILFFSNSCPWCFRVKNYLYQKTLYLFRRITFICH